MPRSPWVYWLGTLIWAGVIFAGSHQSTLPSAGGFASTAFPIVGHLIEYGVLSLLIASGFLRAGRPIAVAGPIAVAIAFVYGISDEWHQSFVPGRDASLGDLVIDLIGATIGLLMAVVLSRHYASHDATNYPAHDR